MLLELDRQSRKFQRTVFASLGMTALLVLIASKLLFGYFAFTIQLFYVIALFALIPVSLIALIISIMFRRLNRQVFCQEQGVRELLQSSPIGILYIDADGVIANVNPAMAAIWSANLSDLEGVKIFRRKKFVQPTVDRLIREGLEGKPFEEEIKVTISGKAQWQWYRGVPVLNPENGAVDALLVLVQDMTNRKQMELELAQYTEQLEHGMADQVKMLKARANELERMNKESEETKLALMNVLEDTRSLEHDLQQEHDRLQAIVSSIGEGVVVADVAGRITFINMAGQNLLGLSPDAAMQSSIFDVVEIVAGREKEPVAVSPIRKSLETRTIERVAMRDDMYWRTTTGRLFPAAFVAAPLLSQEFRGVVIVFRDVTDEKQLDEAKTNFISIASHQLRTPLTAIRWLSELLINEGKGKLQPPLDMYADDIMQSAKRMIVLVNSLLNVSRIESGRITISPKPAHLEKIVESVIKEQEIAARGSRCEIHFQKPRTPLPKLDLDVNLVRQVVQNLLTNAIRYSRPQTCSIDIAIRKEAKRVVLSVKDSGMGIPESAQPRIFEKFFRASNAVKKQTDGTGLGLYISKMILEMTGGSIWFESAENVGSTFYVSIPLSGMQARGGDVSLIAGDEK